MNNVTLGRTGLRVPQNGFGALPIQRIPKADAVRLLRRAFDGGMRFFDTARAYSDSEEKVGEAFAGGLRDQIVLATKTMAKTPAAFREQLETSLRTLRTDHIDLYQFHCVGQCWRPDDGSGMYEEMLAAKAAGKIRHICVTAHLVAVAEACVDSGLYDTLQFPFSYLASEREIALVHRCAAANVGFIAMKALAGGLITRSDAAMAFIAQFPNVLPIWGVQRDTELEEWLSYMNVTPAMTPDREAFIARDRGELSGSFCRGCGYCMPCPAGIQINTCARMSLMLRRAPSSAWLTPAWQAEMAKIDTCVECRRCASRCPYGLDTPALLRANLADYRRVLAGEERV
ncbi:MAG: aldo/keto reductase [Kiritimatiellae bacterium]|nr:aldo/keto reductase [Kiritimatiellia bacterium]